MTYHIQALHMKRVRRVGAERSRKRRKKADRKKGDRHTCNKNKDRGKELKPSDQQEEPHNETTGISQWHTCMKHSRSKPTPDASTLPPASRTTTKADTGKQERDRERGRDPQQNSEQVQISIPAVRQADQNLRRSHHRHQRSVQQP